MLTQLRQDTKQKYQSSDIKKWNFLIHFQQYLWAKESLLTVLGTMKPHLLHSCSTIMDLDLAQIYVAGFPKIFFVAMVHNIHMSLLA